jgi:hypothetical protein
MDGYTCQTKKLIQKMQSFKFRKNIPGRNVESLKMSRLEPTNKVNQTAPLGTHLQPDAKTNVQSKDRNSQVLAVSKPKSQVKDQANTPSKSALADHGVGFTSKHRPSNSDHPESDNTPLAIRTELLCTPKARNSEQPTFLNVAKSTNDDSDKENTPIVKQKETSREFRNDKHEQTRAALAYTPVSKKTLTTRESIAGDDLNVNIPGGSDKENTTTDQKPRKRKFEQVSVPLLIENKQKQFKSINHKEPAFKRFGHLVSSLKLPDKYEKLAALYNSLDNIMVFLKQKQQTCIFDSVRKSIELNANRSFGIKEFRQIMFILPNTFELRRITLKGTDGESFTIEYKVSEQPESDNIFELFKQIPTRRLDFHKKLENLVKEHHQVIFDLITEFFTGEIH